MASTRINILAALWISNRPPIIEFCPAPDFRMIRYAQCFIFGPQVLIEIRSSFQLKEKYIVSVGRCTRTLHFVKMKPKADRFAFGTRSDVP